LVSGAGWYFDPPLFIFRRKEFISNTLVFKGILETILLVNFALVGIWDSFAACWKKLCEQLKSRMLATATKRS